MTSLLSPHPHFEEDDHSPILAHVTQRQPFPPGDVRRLLAANRSAPPRKPKPKAPPLHQQRSSNPSPNKNKQSIILNGIRYVEADVHRITLDIAASATTKVASLVDRGANGGMAGADVRLLETGEQFADVRGIANHEVTNLPISTVAGLVESHLGPVILLMHQYAYFGKGKTIHSALQLEHYGNIVNDRSSKLPGGGQLTKIP